MAKAGNLPMLSIFLLSAIIIACLLGKRYHRLLCAVAILIPFIIYQVFLAGIGGEYFTEEEAGIYYMGSMGLSMLTIGLLQMIKGIEKTSTHSQITIHLQIVSTVFLLCNLVGYVMWAKYMDGSIYNYICLALSLIEAARLIIQTNGDEKDGIDNRSNSWFRNDSQRSMGHRG